MTEKGDRTENSERTDDAALSRRKVLAAVGGIGATVPGGSVVIGSSTPDRPGSSPRLHTNAGVMRQPQGRSWAQPEDIGRGVGASTSTNSDRGLSELSAPPRGRRYYASRKGGIQSAINRASPGDTVVVDETFRISETIYCKSGVNVVGSPNISGSHIEIADGAGIDGISPAHTRNVRLHNLVIDGNRDGGGTQGFDAAIGSREIGFAQNLVISNCTVKRGTQGITIEAGESPYRLKNVSVINCHVDGSHKHGIYMGEYNHSASGRFDNLTIEGNIVTNTERFIGITFQGRESAPVANSEIRYNYVGNVGNYPNAEGGEGVYTEDHVYGTVMEWNFIEDCGSQAGGVTMAGNNWGNIARNNLIRNCYGSLCFSGLWHEGKGPTNCTMKYNTAESVDNWAIRAEEVSTGNAVRWCAFEGYNSRILGGGISLSRNTWNPRYSN